MGPGWCITRRQAGARFWGFELPSWGKLWGWRRERKRGLLVLFSDVYFGWALRKQIRKDSSRRWPSEGAFTSWIVSSVWGCAVVQDCWVSVNGSSESWDGLGLPHTGEAGPWHRDQTRGPLRPETCPQKPLESVTQSSGGGGYQAQRGPLRKRDKGGQQWCGWDLSPGQQGLLGAGPGGWGLGGVRALGRAERGVYHTCCWLCFHSSLPSALSLTPRQMLLPGTTEFPVHQQEPVLPPSLLMAPRTDLVPVRPQRVP